MKEKNIKSSILMSREKKSIVMETHIVKNTARKIFAVTYNRKLHILSINIYIKNKI